MRNDLTLLCENCALRLPSSEGSCPRCGGMLRVARDARERDALQRMAGGIRPFRDLALFVPVVASLTVGVWAAVDNVTLELSFTPVLQILFWFDMAMIVMGIAWLGWALAVVIASGLWNALRAESLLVVAVPRTNGDEPRMPKWTLPASRGGEAVEWRDLVPALVLVVIGWALTIAGFAKGMWPGAGAAVVMLLLCTLLTALGAMLLAWIVWWLRFAARKVLLAFARMTADDASPLTNGRRQLSGLVRAGERELIAPLSGKPCIAFRIAGRMGRIEIDDALAAPMLLESDQGTIALRAQRWLVTMPVSAPPTERFDEEQVARLKRFITSRGLQFTPSLEIGEAILDDGDRVDAWGALGMSEVPTYRDRGALELTDSDGKPLVLQRSTPTPTPTA